jgi:hypothetical protein
MSDQISELNEADVHGLPAAQFAGFAAAELSLEFLRQAESQTSANRAEGLLTTTEELNPALGEFLLVLRFVVQEWGRNNVMILVPQTWQREIPDVGVPIYFASDSAVTIFVDSGDHYIQYHSPVEELFP